LNDRQKQNRGTTSREKGFPVKRMKASPPKNNAKRRGRLVWSQGKKLTTFATERTKSAPRKPDFVETRWVTKDK